MTKSILNFNGGLDSTYVLWKTLSQTDEEVTALTFKFSGDNQSPATVRLGEDHQDVKLTIVDSMANWLKTNVRSFNHVVIDFDPSYLDDAVSFEDATFKKTTEIYLVKYGIQNGFDKIISSFEKDNDGFSAASTTFDVDKRRTPLSGEMRGAFKRMAKSGEISFMLLDMNYHQAYAIRELPVALFNMTRSCDAETSEPCGVCFKCSKRQFFMKCIADGKTNADIQSIIDNESLTNDGRWISMKWWLRDHVGTYKSFAGKNDDTDPVYNKEKQVWAMPLWPPSLKL